MSWRSTVSAFLAAAAGCGDTGPERMSRPVLWNPARSAEPWVPAPTRKLDVDAASLADDGTLWVVTEGELRQLDPVTLDLRSAHALPVTRQVLALDVSPSGTWAAVVTRDEALVRLQLNSSDDIGVHSVDFDRVHAVVDLTIDDRGRVHSAVMNGSGGCTGGSYFDTSTDGGAAPDDRLVRLPRGVATRSGVWLAPSVEWTDAASITADETWVVARSDDDAWVLQGPLTEADRALRAPASGPLALNPAGRWLLAVHGDAALLWDLTTGAAAPLELQRGLLPVALAWSADGREAAVLSTSRRDSWSRLSVYRLDDSQTLRLAWRRDSEDERDGALRDLRPSDSVAMAVSADTVIAATIGDGRPKLAVLAADGADRTWSGDAARFLPTMAVSISPDGRRAAWRAGPERVEVFTHVPFISESFDVELAAANDGDGFDIAMRDDALLLHNKVEDRRVPLDGSSATLHQRHSTVFWQARAAIARLGRRGRKVHWGAMKGRWSDYERRAARPAVSADGTVAWTDGEGRVWVETDDGHPPRLLAGPALPPQSVELFDLSPRVELVRTGSTDLVGAWSRREDPERVVLGRTPNGRRRAVEGFDGSVLVYEKGREQPVLALLDWPEWVPRCSDGRLAGDGGACDDGEDPGDGGSEWRPPITGDGGEPEEVQKRLDR